MVLVQTLMRSFSYCSDLQGTYGNRFTMRVQLTKKIISSTLPRDRPYELRDAQVRGLALRVQPSGHMAWNWADIHFEARMLTVRRENAKSGKQRHIPLNDEALSTLVKWRGLTDSTGSVFGIKGLKTSWDKLLSAASINDLRFHDLRHHFASRLVMNGVDLNTVRELLGHADLTMTLRYAHLAAEHLAAAVNRLSAPVTSKA